MTKLCPRGKSAAKRKFKVYPSAYANAYASKICAGKIKDPKIGSISAPRKKVEVLKNVEENLRVDQKENIQSASLLPKQRV
jgi:hypothetical protein